MQLRRKSLIVSMVICAGSFIQTAQAQFNHLGTLFNGAYFTNRGSLFNLAHITGDHTLISNPQGGPLFDNNIYDQRLELNRTGQGYTFEQFHFFGPDSFDNPNTLDLGAFKVQLGRDPTVTTNPQPVGIHNKIGYTTTLIPEVFFQSQTGQRNFDIFSGQTSFTPVPLNYTATFDSGIQKFEWAGNVLVDARGNMNAMGFYDMKLKVQNVGNYTADGVADHDAQVTDFDTGPIDVSGNIFLDAISSFAQAAGAPGEATTPRTVSAATSSKGKTVDELMSSLKAGDKLSDEDMSFLMTEMIKKAFLDDPLGFIQNGMPKTVPGFEALSLEVSDDQTSAQQAAQQTNVPEPGTLVLLAATGAIFLGLERRLRRRPDY